MSIQKRSNAVLAVVVLTFFAVPVSAQTIQLPVFSNFSYSGAVRVPDGGGIWAGGIKSHSEGSTSRGVPLVGGIPGVNRGFQNRGIGRETGSSGISFHPQVLIMSELEEDHLARAGYGPDGRRAGANDAVAAKAAFLTRHMGRSGLGSMSDWQGVRPR
jgi:hypothetical protein